MISKFSTKIKFSILFGWNVYNYKNNLELSVKKQSVYNYLKFWNFRKIKWDFVAEILKFSVKLLDLISKILKFPLQNPRNFEIYGLKHLLKFFIIGSKFPIPLQNFQKCFWSLEILEMIKWFCKFRKCRKKPLSITTQTIYKAHKWWFYFWIEVDYLTPKLKYYLRYFHNFQSHIFIISKQFMDEFESKVR